MSKSILAPASFDLLELEMPHFDCIAAASGNAALIDLAFAFVYKLLSLGMVTKIGS